MIPTASQVLSHPDRYPDFTTRRIATLGQGEGGCGDHVVIGASAFGRDACHRARVEQLITSGIPEEVATQAASAPRGMELAVARLAADLVHLHGVALLYLASPSGRRPDYSHFVFDELTGTKSSMSLPRKLSALEIARRVVKPPVKGKQWKLLDCRVEPASDDEIFRLGDAFFRELVRQEV